ncbi:MAG: potassium-transporting ATPase subunit KdpA [Comamonadaceae bacterium]|nr:potassium-transporting ATPase subunit KdpA [Comamonadaceae bacterium]
MVGRTPEYLGKKIEAYDVKIACSARPGHRASASSASPPGRRSAAGGWPA